MRKKSAEPLDSPDLTRASYIDRLVHHLVAALREPRAAQYAPFPGGGGFALVAAAVAALATCEDDELAALTGPLIEAARRSRDRAPATPAPRFPFRVIEGGRPPA